MNPLPPITQMLLQEPIKAGSFHEFHQRVVELLPEFRPQAEWTLENHSYFDEKPHKRSGEFIVRAATGMDPFSRTGKCAELKCRLEMARRFSQTFGLYSDRIILPDPFTPYFLGDEQWTERETDSFLADLLVLREMKPLIDAQVIQFSNSTIGYCRSCYRKLSKQISKIVDEIVTSYSSEVSFKKANGIYLIDTGNLYDPSLAISVEDLPAKRGPLSRLERHELAKRLSSSIAQEVEEILLQIRQSDGRSDAFLSNSRIALNAIRSIEGRGLRASEVNVWEDAHSADLPWVKSLSVEQIVRLREEAADALPQFRETMSHCLGPNGVPDRNGSSQRSTDAIRELRTNAEELTAELKVIRLGSERLFHNIGGSLGLTVSVYGFGTELITAGAAFGTLLSTLGLIHTVHQKQAQDLAKLKSKPAYVLVKARELMAHAS